MALNLNGIGNVDSYTLSVTFMPAHKSAHDIRRPLIPPTALDTPSVADATSPPHRPLGGVRQFIGQLALTALFNRLRMGTGGT